MKSNSLPLRSSWIKEMQEEGAEEIWSLARTVWVREEGGKEWRMFSKAGELDKGWTTRALEVVVVRSWRVSPFKKATLLVWRPDIQEARVTTIIPVIRILLYSDRSWWQLGLTGVGDGQKQMVLRFILRDKMKSLKLPCSYVSWLMLTHYSEVNFQFLRESFPDIPDEIIWKLNKCLCNWHDREYSWACTKGKDLVEREGVKISKKRDN